VEHQPADRLDEPGGTYDHVAPGLVPPPDAAAAPGQLGFAFDRSGYRVPALLVSPWVAEGEVFTAEHRHTSLIATLREAWGLGDPLTARDAAARPFTSAFTLDTPRDPETWPVAEPRSVPQYVVDALLVGNSLSSLGAAVFDGMRAYAAQHHIHIEGLPADPGAPVPPQTALHVVHNFFAIQFPLLASTARADQVATTVPRQRGSEDVPVAESR
jgi:phospholipase C